MTSIESKKEECYKYNIGQIFYLFNKYTVPIIIDGNPQGNRIIRKVYGWISEQVYCMGSGYKCENSTEYTTVEGELVSARFSFCNKHTKSSEPGTNNHICDCSLVGTGPMYDGCSPPPSKIPLGNIELEEWNKNFNPPRQNAADYMKGWVSGKKGGLTDEKGDIISKIDWYPSEKNPSQKPKPPGSKNGCLGINWDKGRWDK